MPRYLTLAIEGFVIGIIFGVPISLITLDFLSTVLVCGGIGIIARFVFDYVWELYNRMTGKT